MARKPNLILIGIDSLRRDHMSLYGYPRLTTPHIDLWAAGGTVYENHFSPHIPTTPGYGNMLTGMDCFGTNIVALRHQGTYADGVKTLAELLGEVSYQTVCVGFEGNPAARGFQRYVNYAAWDQGGKHGSPKAEMLNAATFPVLKELAASNQPFFLFLRHMDPHSPYAPPPPFDRIFYGKDEYDPANRTMQAVYDFAPFADYFKCWIPPGVTDKDFVIALYDGAVAYMDACIQNLFTLVAGLGLEEDTLIVLTSDHGETLYDHDCYFDHHGLYDPTLVVPLVFRLPGKIPAGRRIAGYSTHMNVTPTILDVLGIKPKVRFDGTSLLPEMRGHRRKPDREFYITECTWMRKHGWRTPEWKLIVALEPDFHYKPEVELYNLVDDPQEEHNVAVKEKKTVEWLRGRMEAWIARREKETKRRNPMYSNLHWHGSPNVPGPFESSDQAYTTLHIGDPEMARRLQAEAAKR